MKNNLPIWIKSLTIRSVKKGLNKFWRVITYSNSFNTTTKPRIRCEYITNFYTKEEAIAQAIHNARSIYIYSRGAWIVSKVKEKYGNRICIIGNIDSSRTLPYGTSEEVATEVREAIDIAAPGWGYILASDHSLHDGIPVENIVALFHTGAEYGREFYKSYKELGG